MGAKKKSAVKPRAKSKVVAAKRTPTMVAKRKPRPLAVALKKKRATRAVREADAKVVGVPVRMMSATTFAVAKAAFDAKHANLQEAECLVPVRGESHLPVGIRDAKGHFNEEYYKWQFVNAIIKSGMYPKDLVGVEVHFPKGNKGSHPLKVDGAIFDDPEWVTRYSAFWRDRKPVDLEWLNRHLLAVIEFKRDDKDIEKVFTGQVKPAMREKEPATAPILGIYYDTERLYLFQRRNGTILRYDDSKNLKGDSGDAGALSLHIPDAYAYLPSLEELERQLNKPRTLDRSTRGIADLDVITSISSVQVQSAFSDVLRALDKTGLVNQRGYSLLVQTLALKIFDEKRNEQSPQHDLEVYATDAEAGFESLADKSIQGLIARLKAVRRDASSRYQKILQSQEIDWRNQSNVRAVVAIITAFQDYSFVRSAKSDLYQLVFYNFANSFRRDEAAQFLTPLPVIDFIVKMVNPRARDTVFDPCCGIRDFLSLAFVNGASKSPRWQLDDANIYGVDLDENMITLATLNMLLNGDGEAKLFSKSDKGSILTKIAKANPPGLKDLLPDQHRNGAWGDWPDSTELMEFDVVLTNPPFGEDRAYRVKSEHDREIIEMYETWHLTRQARGGADSASIAKESKEKRKKSEKAKGSDALDLGVVFLENAYRVLKDGGRLGIVLSNSIASINKWSKVREWLMERMRLVAFLDLPSNVFAETGVNTSVLIAYKPKAKAMQRLNEQGYKIFVRDIQRVGYEKRTSKRNVFFNPLFKMNETTFEVEVDGAGNPIVDEEFTDILGDFRTWALGQEAELQKAFLEETSE
jgi:type I restriction enzyme M protein